MANPGIPVGGANPVVGGTNVRHRCFWQNVCETKELGPVEGVSQGCPLDQPLVMPVLYAQ